VLALYVDVIDASTAPVWLRQGDAHMSVEFQSHLIGSPHYDPEAPAIPFLNKVWALNKDMLLGSASISSVHQWESKVRWTSSSSCGSERESPTVMMSPLFG
jgi:hypothetical protein